MSRILFCFHCCLWFVLIDLDTLPLPTPLCLSVAAVQSRTPALVFECINNTDFKVQRSPLFCMLLGVCCWAYEVTFNVFCLHWSRPPVYHVPYCSVVISRGRAVQGAAALSWCKCVFPCRSCTRSWQIMIYVSICMNYWRWDLLHYMMIFYFFYF